MRAARRCFTATLAGRVDLPRTVSRLGGRATLIDHALPLARELGDPVPLAYVLGNAGLEALFVDDLDRAQDAFEEQLRLCRDHVVTHLGSEVLGGLAAIATRRSDPERAARLLGAASVTGPVGDADVNAQFEERFFAPARARHGTRRWSEAHAAGAEMTFEQAVEFALGPVAWSGATLSSPEGLNRGLISPRAGPRGLSRRPGGA